MGVDSLEERYNKKSSIYLLRILFSGNDAYTAEAQQCALNILVNRLNLNINAGRPDVLNAILQEQMPGAPEGVNRRSFIFSHAHRMECLACGHAGVVQSKKAQPHDARELIFHMIDRDDSHGKLYYECPSCKSRLVIGLLDALYYSTLKARKHNPGFRTHREEMVSPDEEIGSRVFSAIGSFVVCVIACMWAVAAGGLLGMAFALIAAYFLFRTYRIFKNIGDLLRNRRDEGK